MQNDDTAREYKERLDDSGALLGDTQRPRLQSLTLSKFGMVGAVLAGLFSLMQAGASYSFRILNEVSSLVLMLEVVQYLGSLIALSVILTLVGLHAVHARAASSWTLVESRGAPRTSSDAYFRPWIYGRVARVALWTAVACAALAALRAPLADIVEYVGPRTNLDPQMSRAVFSALGASSIPLSVALLLAGIAVARTRVLGSVWRWGPAMVGAISCAQILTALFILPSLQALPSATTQILFQALPLIFSGLAWLATAWALRKYQATTSRMPDDGAAPEADASTQDTSE